MKKVVKDYCKEWSDSFGKQFALISRIYSVVSNMLSALRIGPEIASWVKSPAGVCALEDAVAVLADRFLLAQPASEARVWKCLKRNPEYQSLDDYRSMLELNRFTLDRWAMEAFDRLDLSEGESDLDLYRISPASLGIPCDTSLRNFYKVALAQGFELCPPWVLLQLCDEYFDQPSGEVLYVSTELLPDSVGDCGGFCVGRERNQRRLKKIYCMLRSCELCVFVRPRGKQADTLF